MGVIRRRNARMLAMRRLLSALALAVLCGAANAAKPTVLSPNKESASPRALSQGTDQSSKFNFQGSRSASLPVTIEGPVITEKTAGERALEKAIAADQIYQDERTLVFTRILAVATVVLAIATAVLAWLTGNLWGATREAERITRRIERAYIKLL